MTDNTEINGAPAAEETNEQHKNPLEQELAASTVPSFDLAASKDCEEEDETPLVENEAAEENIPTAESQVEEVVVDADVAAAPKSPPLSAKEPQVDANDISELEIGTAQPDSVAVDSSSTEPESLPLRQTGQQLTDRQVKARARRSANKEGVTPGAVAVAPRSPPTARPRSTPPPSPSKAETARLQRNLQHLEARRRANPSNVANKTDGNTKPEVDHDGDVPDHLAKKTVCPPVAASEGETVPLTMADIMVHHQELQRQKRKAAEEDAGKSSVAHTSMAVAAADMDTVPSGDANVAVADEQHGQKPVAAVADAEANETAESVATTPTQQEYDAKAKSRGARNTSSMAPRPGAVAISGTSANEEATAATATPPTQQERDLQAKSRGSRTSNRSVPDDAPATSPGAVAVPGENGNSNTGGNFTKREQDARIKARAGQRRSTTVSATSAAGVRRSMMNQEPSTTSLSTNTSGMLSAATASVSVDSSGDVGMEELARRREERAIERESRRAERGLRSSQQDDSGNPDSADHHTEAMDAATSTVPASAIGNIRENTVAASSNAESVAPSSVASFTTSRSTPLFANMDDNERQRRFDEKMAQMDREHQERLWGGGTQQQMTLTRAPPPSSLPTSSTAVALETRTASGDDISSEYNDVSTAATTGSSVFASMLEEEQQQRVDAKLSDLSQNRLEKFEDGEVNQANVGVTIARSRDMQKGRDSKDSLGPLALDGQEQARTPVNGCYLDQGLTSLPDVEAGEFRDVSDNQLAIAVAIDIDEDGDETKKLVSAHAVEYDPDSKPPLYKNRRFRLYGIGGCCIILIIAIALIAASASRKDSGGIGGSVKLIYLTNEPSAAPTQAPTNARESLYRGFFADELNSTLVYDQGTPHFMASEWIMNEDPAQLEIDSPRLLQRYMLAFWYYHTTNMGESPWRSCNPPGPGEEETCVFLEFGRDEDDSIVYQEIPNKVRWMSSQNECEWQGAICGDETTVVGIRMVGQDLVGTLPTEMRSLPFLQVLSVHYNMFTGTIPPEYANFRHLLALEVHGNLLNGQIPTEFYEQDSKSLITLNVGDNALTGTLDTRVGQLTDLKGLFVFGNNLNGSIPEEIGNLRYLTYTRFFGCGFSGQLPSGIGRLVQLTEFWYNTNFFTGTLPPELGNLRRMTDFRFSENQIVGSIPPELFNMTRAQYIQLDRNLLSGPLPSSELLQMTDLVWLSVSRNQLTGSIPTELRAMPSLRLVWLHLNQFTGSVPDTVCEANVPNGLNFIQADCAPLENPPNPCRCCSACCDRTTENCLETDNAI